MKKLFDVFQHQKLFAVIALLLCILFLIGCVQKKTEQPAAQELQNKVQEVIDQHKEAVETIPPKQEEQIQIPQENSTKKNEAMKKEETPLLSNPPTKTPATEPVVIFQGSFRPIQQAVQGEARIIKQGTKTTLKLSPFRISNGPKLHVYLSKHPNPSRKEEIGESYVDLGALQTYFGFQEYTIPTDIDLTKYHAAVIYSEAYDVLYATAPLTRT